MEENIWSDRDLGKAAVQPADSVSSNVIDYFCDINCPFIQLVNSNAEFKEEVQLNFIKTPHDWVIHDYGDAISVAASHTKNKKTDYILDSQKTIEEMAKLINKKGWTSIEIIAGTSAMKKFMWIESKRYGFSCVGYSPTKEDIKRYEILVKTRGTAWEHPVANRSKNEITTAK